MVRNSMYWKHKTIKVLVNKNTHGLGIKCIKTKSIQTMDTKYAKSYHWKVIYDILPCFSSSNHRPVTYQSIPAGKHSGLSVPKCFKQLNHHHSPQSTDQRHKRRRTKKQPKIYPPCRLTGPSEYPRVLATRFLKLLLVPYSKTFTTQPSSE